MKFLLIPLALALVAGNALACPGDSKSKDAMAPAAAQKVATAKAKPAPAVVAPGTTEVAAKPAAEVRKVSTL